MSSPITSSSTPSSAAEQGGYIEDAGFHDSPCGYDLSSAHIGEAQRCQGRYIDTAGCDFSPAYVEKARKSHGPCIDDHVGFDFSPAHIEEARRVWAQINKEHIAEKTLPRECSVLSDVDIRREIAKGRIVLHDPENDCRGNIQNCSVDITLGPWFYRNTKRMAYFDPSSAAHVHEYWGEAQKADIVVFPNDGRQSEKAGILLAPGETILAHTREFIGGVSGITTMVKARSSMGRSNITICRDAGWGDVGYYNRWCLEISNSSTCPVFLTVGQRIGQVVFFYMSSPGARYAGKYQIEAEEVNELVKAWHPSALLPKLYLDK